MPPCHAICTWLVLNSPFVFVTLLSQSYCKPQVGWRWSPTQATQLFNCEVGLIKETCRIYSG